MISIVPERNVLKARTDEVTASISGVAVPVRLLPLTAQDQLNDMDGATTLLFRTASCIVEHMDATLLKGLTALETLARLGRRCGISELMDELGLPKSNVHRTLATLSAAGFVDQDGDGKYGCTLKLFELGSLITDSIDVRESSIPAMERLSENTKEAVHLAVLDGAEVIYLNKIESPQPIRAYTRVGGRAPAHAVASGKALLAYQTFQYLHSQDFSYQEFTDNTIKTLEDLETQLTKIRELGHAVNQGEWRKEVGGVAAAIFDHENRPVAAIGVSGPMARIEQYLKSNTESVCEAAKEVSMLIGCSAYEQVVNQWKDR